MKIKNYLAKVSILSTFILPSIALGATTTTGTISTTGVCSNSSIQNSIGDLFNFFSCILRANVVSLLITIAMIGFIWGVIQMFINPNNEEARKQGKSYVIWGLVGLFVIISVWGLVGVLTNTFGISNLIPQLSNQ